MLVELANSFSIKIYLLTFLFQKIYVKKCFPLDLYSIVNHVPIQGPMYIMKFIVK